VANLPDRRVEAVAEGPADRVDQLAALLASGPALARVDRLERTELSCFGGESGFTVRG
jgi:acylphosphatase